MLAELKRTYDAGVLLLTGTDPPNFGLDYGESLHHELALFVEAGISVESTLECATTIPLKVYGYQVRAIEEGNPASFFLVEGNPQVNITDTERIKMRWKRGALIEQSNEF